MKRWGFFILLALLVAIVGFPLRSLAFDDAYITYRYARNIARGEGFVYNKGERILSTTAPLYALLLAIGSFLYPDIPSLSNLISILSLFGAGCFTYLLGKHFKREIVGAIAAFFLVAFPLMWLSIGFEICFALMLILGAFYFYFVERFTLSTLLLAFAILTRPDGVIPAALIASHYIYTYRRIPLRQAGLFLGITSPFIIYLTLFFGSPLPATLSAKKAQAIFGITGFYTGTSFLEGMWILIRALIEQNPLYWLFFPPFLAGIWMAFTKEEWILPYLSWAFLHFFLYQSLKTAPYHWHYAPMVPAFAMSVASGLAEISGRLKSALRFLPSLIVGAFLLCVELSSDFEIYRALSRPDLPPPTSISAKVLPEAKTDIYREVGLWLKSESPPDAVVGVMEVGIIGYYSERKMVDFLGLLQIQTAKSLRRGDIYRSIPHYQPDYLILTNINPLYSYKLEGDEWFESVYFPVKRFSDERFWGSPVTVHQRRTPNLPLVEKAIGVEFNGSFELVRYGIDRHVVEPGDPLRLKLVWRLLGNVEEDYIVTARLVDLNWNLAGQRDVRYSTTSWKKGDIVDYYHTLVIREGTPPGKYFIKVGMWSAETGQSLGEDVTLSYVKVPLPSVDKVKIEHLLDLNLGEVVNLMGYNLSSIEVESGEAINLTLYWQCRRRMDEDYTVFVHLLDEEGEIVVQKDNWPRENTYPTSIWDEGEVIEDEYTLTIGEDVPQGDYRIVVGMYLLATGERLSISGDDAHTLEGDRILLGKITVMR